MGYITILSLVVLLAIIGYSNKTLKKRIAKGDCAIVDTMKIVGDIDHAIFLNLNNQINDLKKELVLLKNAHAVSYDILNKRIDDLKNKKTITSKKN